MLQIDEEQISSSSAGRQVTCWLRLIRRQEARRAQRAMVAAPLWLPSLLSPKLVVVVWSESSEVTPYPGRVSSS